MEHNETIRDAAIRLTMMPRDTNAHGTVFGGVILSYIDVAGGVEAIRHTRHNRFVTVAMKEVIFHEPVFIGDPTFSLTRSSSSKKRREVAQKVAQRAVHAAKHADAVRTQIWTTYGNKKGHGVSVA